MKPLLARACLANFALVNLALALPAWAQQSDATDGLGSVSSENPFGRDRNTSVLDRPRPDYVPVPTRIGTVEVLPRVALGTGYDDNLYATRGNRVDDAYLRVRPRVTITRPSPDLRLSLNAELDLLRYADRASENATQYVLDGRALYTIRRDTTLSVQLVNARYSEERVSPDSPTGVVRPNRFTLTSGNASLSHVFNRLRVRGVVDVENRNYRDGRSPTGAVVDQDFRDRTTITTTGIGEYALSPSIALFLAGSYNWRDYRTRIGPVPARDSTGYELTAGSSFELGRKMRGSLRVGYLRQHYRDRFFDDISGLLVRGELAWFATPLVTVTGRVDRTVSETGVAGAGGYLKTTAGLRADYELLRNLIFSAGGELEKRDFSNIDRNDDRWTWRFNGTYLLSHRLSLRGEFQRRTQSSRGALPGRQFNDNRISLGITLSGI